MNTNEATQVPADFMSVTWRRRQGEGEGLQRVAIPAPVGIDAKEPRMSIQVKIAETSTEIDQLFQLRHRVFCEERRYMRPTPDGRLYDRFDSLPGVANVIAIVDGEVAGGWRLVEETGAGLPAYDYYDFASQLPRRSSVRLSSVGMVVIHPDHRGKKLFFPMSCVGHRWAVQRGISHILAPASPEMVPLAADLGYVPLTPEFFHERLRLKVTPMVLDMLQMSSRLANAVVGRIEATRREGGANRGAKTAA